MIPFFIWDENPRGCEAAAMRGLTPKAPRSESPRLQFFIPYGAKTHQHLKLCHLVSEVQKSYKEIICEANIKNI